MRNIFIVTWFTIKETIKKKSFIVSNIIILLFILIIFSVIKLLFGNYSLAPENVSNNVIATNSIAEAVTEDKSNSNKDLTKILLIDSDNILGNKKNNLNDENIEFILSGEIQNEAIYKKIDSNEIYSAVKIYKKDKSFGLDYIVRKQERDSEPEATYILNILNACYLDNILSEYNVSSDVISEIIEDPEFEIVSEKLSNSFDASLLIGMFVSFVLFFAIYLYGHSISASIASEKNSRVMETLVTSSSPTHIILGKTLGMGILGLAQMLCIAIVTLVSYKTFIPAGLDVISLYLPNIRIDAFSILILILYFILGYTLYAFLNAVTGATVSKSEDIQTANLPLSFITMFSFYLSVFTMDSSNSKLNNIASIFPLSSPFSMPGKVLAGLVNNYEVLASVFVLLITTIFLAFVSIKLYSIAILHYGNRLTFKDLIKMLLKIRN